jgi:flagellar biosynthetic protein FliP
MKIKNIAWFGSLFLFSTPCWSDATIPLITSAQKNGGTTYSASIEILILMTALTFLPAILMTMTSFMRIIIVLSLLRQALGVSQTPSNQILVGISLFLTIFIMSPVFHQMNNDAVAPYLDNKITLTTALARGSEPLHNFMLNQTRKNDINFFVDLSGIHRIEKRRDIPFSVLIPAYMTSELETAFQIGFLLFIPFLIIDLIVSTTLMAMGMMMVSPMLISMPLKIMLFVMINGWHLIFQTLANSFYK